ncbi:MAG: DUF1223 domain-containing protein [Rickettsiales bacterium]|nr:DUF1223 domain-containing protein [Pseudomonadota bacterium]MDA0965959.1 DUF1223 domain-containing protein [Pseudomonadota bacterium]MDG4542569.1 DUF1223 domain-containing protein [Rickettsiales bacterium]MDG4545073.1 DUF1223 domain-containing protein [Rickettsiales bacterium]MDG4547196.1 DUF1223 domain-containing protein [Rickettsiales bacterium]
MGILAKSLSFITILFYGQSVFAADDKLAPRPVIVEFFTSQGCSSCPPADEVLKYLKENNPNVIPLSMHVDYWNYIGWKDPFSSDLITKRQRGYAYAMQKRRVYTPQAVIDGKYEVIGSSYSKVDSLIKKALSSTQDVYMSAKITGDKLEVNVLPHVSQPEQKADIVVIGYDFENTTKVTRGENSGELLTNANIVRHIERIGLYEGEKISVTSDIPDTDNFIVILQKEGQKEIIGLAIAN